MKKTIGTPVKFTTSLLAAVLCAPLVLTACSPAEENPSSSGADTATVSADVDDTGAAYPRTVTIDDQEITLESEPVRIAVVTPEAASLVLPLAGPERVVLTSEMNPEDEDLYALAEQVPTKVKPGGSVDPEQVMAADPDLVIVSARFDTEQDTIDILEGFGVPVVNFDIDGWNGIDSIITHMTYVGELVGAEEEAARAIAEIEETRAEVEQPEEAPRVLAMMQRGPRQMIMPESSMMSGLIREAGGIPVVDSLGATGTVTADPEQVVAMNPDIIIIQDYLGRGREDFADLLNNPALAEVPAIAEDKVFYADTRTTGFTAGTDITQGLLEVSEMIRA